MTTDHISTYKGDFARKAREAVEAARGASLAQTPAAPKPQAQAPPASALAPKAQASPARAAGGNGVQDGGSIVSVR